MVVHNDHQDFISSTSFGARSGYERAKHSSFFHISEGYDFQMTDKSQQVCRFKKIGSTGLIVFERDGTLLKTRRRSKDLSLNDINRPLIRLLRHLRRRGIRFGFLSGNRGMDAAYSGRPAAQTLIDLMNVILQTDRAEPDFWIAMPLAKLGRDVKAQQVSKPANFSFMLRQAMEWYGVPRRKVVFVGSASACAMASNTAGVSTVNYSAPPLSSGEDQSAYLPEIQQIEAAVESILSSGQYHQLS